MKLLSQEEGAAMSRLVEEAGSRRAAGRLPLVPAC